MKKRLLIALVVLSLMLPVVASCAEEGEKVESYKIGVIAALSGFAADNGRPARDGFVWAVEQANKEGGVNGHEIKLVVYDGRSDVNVAMLAARKLIHEDKVLAIAELGAGTEMALQAMKPICQDAGITQLSIGISFPLLERPAEWIFTEAPHQSWNQAAFYGFWKERGLTKVGLIAESYGFGLSGREVMEALAPKAGIELVASEQFGPTDVDMTPQLWKIKMADPEVLVVLAVTMPGAIAIAQARDLGIDVPIITLTPVVEPVFVEIWPEALEGIYTLMCEGDIWWELPEDNPVRPKTEALEAGIREEYGRELAMFDRRGADVALILLEALRLANIEAEELAEARALLRDAMERVEFAGTETRYKYTPEDHTGLSEPFGMGVVENGIITLVEWEDIENNLYWPDGYDGLMGM